ncbi:lipopolysaccharide N-acetylglucosaminyltransferase [Escherichia whittamii]|uniref:Lipopolysaccharide N-acetylglucosaminyltransferase n=1 Tax=Escherichia whittamii TaxID=2762229 RepID=A0ABR8TDR3_9ESCH|nr:lipopolysaccharide N-acetylglucosaminyltransferase [Escherichia whittamii]MBD7973663.1 lipopolysaccharide N-acetylglucosaminyltransferase [Escherichia whittamii]MCA4893077.1 lipopolysaccharide N-acetylglucosaminyltransferase [Escherichia whittamii]
MIKKIIFTVTPIFSIPPKGAAAVETWIYQVAKRLSIPATIACIRNDGYPTYTKVNDNCDIHYIGFSRVYKRLFQKWTRLDPVPYSQRILNTQPKNADSKDSVIVIHNSMKLYKQIRGRSPQAQLVMHLHNAFELGQLDKNAKIIVPSQFLFDFYSEKMPAADIAIVPNGFCAESYLHDNTVDLRKKFNIDANDTVLLFAGRISPDKGCLMLMDAFNKLCKDRDNLKLVIVGDPFASKKGEKAEYQKKVLDEAKAIGAQCIMAGGQPPEQMHNYYRLADLVVVPSQVEEAFCMVAVEAMAAGKPVLASQKGGISEFVLEGITGYHLAEPMTSESILADIKRVLADADREQIAENARNFVFSKYSWEHVTQSFEAQIRDWFG